MQSSAQSPSEVIWEATGFCLFPPHHYFLHMFSVTFPLLYFPGTLDSLMSFKYTWPQDLCACCLCYFEPSSLSILTTSDIHLNSIIVVKPCPGYVKLHALLPHQWPALYLLPSLLFFL